MATSPSRRPMIRLLYRSGLAIFSATSLVGLLVSVWAHIVALSGMDPRSEFHRIWVFQIVLFALILPIVIVLIRYGVKANIFRSPRWARRSLYVLLGYYAFHFYLFLYTAAHQLDSWETWRMFSSGWLLLFSLSVVYYGVRFSETKQWKD